MGNYELLNKISLGIAAAILLLEIVSMALIAMDGCTLRGQYSLAAQMINTAIWVFSHVLATVHVMVCEFYPCRKYGVSVLVACFLLMCTQTNMTWEFTTKQMGCMNIVLTSFTCSLFAGIVAWLSR